MAQDVLLLNTDAIAAATSGELIAAARELLITAFDVAGEDSGSLSSQALLTQIETLQSVVNSAQGTQSLRIAQVATIESARDKDTGAWREVRHPLGWADDWIATELGPLLGWSPRQVDVRLQDSVDAATLTPRLLREVGNGRLEHAKMAKVLSGLQFAPDDVCAAVESDLLDRGIGGMTTTQIARRVARLLAKLDPVAAESATRKRRREEIGVFTRASSIPGLCEMTCLLPADKAAAIMASVEELARQLHRDTTTDKTLGECRADALSDLVLQNVELRSTVVFQLPVDRTASPPGDRPASPPTGVLPDVPVDRPINVDQPDNVDQPINVDQPDNLDQPDNADSLARVAALHDELFPDPYAEVAAGRAHWLRYDDHPPDDRDDDWDDAYEHDDRDCDWDGEPDWDRALAELLEMKAKIQHCDWAVRDDHTPTSANPTDVAFTDVVLPGIGVISADHVVHIANFVGTNVARRLVDVDSGALVESTSKTYRPTAAIARFVRERDEHCRFPGCVQLAKYCDADHVIPWPAGPTSPANLQSLCRHHHRAKHETAWQVTMTADGVCTWTSPGLRTYVTKPADKTTVIGGSVPLTTEMTTAVS